MTPAEFAARGPHGGPPGPRQLITCSPKP
jgi:hypothetical protein